MDFFVFLLDFDQAKTRAVRTLDRDLLSIFYGHAVELIYKFSNSRRIDFREMNNEDATSFLLHSQLLEPNDSMLRFVFSLELLLLNPKT